MQHRLIVRLSPIITVECLLAAMGILTMLVMMKGPRVVVSCDPAPVIGTTAILARSESLRNNLRGTARYSTKVIGYALRDREGFKKMLQDGFFVVALADGGT